MRSKQLILCCIVFALLVGCNGKRQNNDVHSGSIYMAKIYETKGAGFGYDIYKDSILMIHQPIIPGLQGNQGFLSKEDAQKVADLMIEKLDKSIMPPSITSDELDSLNVLP